MALKRLTLIRGDSQTYGITFRRADSSLYNIKNWAVFFTVKSNWSLPDSESSFQKIVTAFNDTTAGTSGSASITITPTDTVNLDPGEYDFDIAVCTDSGKVFTVLKGKFDLEYDVTRSAGTAGTV